MLLFDRLSLSPHLPPGDKLSEEVQRRIAELAFERGYLDFSTLTDILLQIGRRLASDDGISFELWTDRGWLTADQLRKLLAEISPEHDIDMTGAESAPPRHDGGRENAFERIETEVYPDEKRQARDEHLEDQSEGHFRTGDWEETAPETAPDVEALDDREVSREPSRAHEPHGDDRSATGDTNDTLTDLPPEYFQKAPAARELSDEESGDDEAETYAPERLRSSLADASLLDAVGRGATVEPGERFRLGKRIGSGGSGRVVRAYDRLLGRHVAMKLLRADPTSTPTAVARFLAEAQATGQLEHPNIVPIYDFGLLPDHRVFYTMREVQGHSLRQVLNGVDNGDEDYRAQYTLVRLLNILRQVSQATHYAHDQSVIHRDLKPENVMLGDFGEVLVMDWGLARVIESRTDFTEGSSPSSSGQTLGTPSYMPPEQAKGDLERVDETSDIYSLGAILYEILTLEPPFTGDGPLDVMWSVVDCEVEPPSERAPDRVPDELERICLKAMAKRQRDRYESARDFHDDLEAWLEGRQPREAERLVREGDTAADRYHELLDEIEQYNEEVRRLSAQIDDWEGLEEKRQLWGVEDERDATEAESARAFCEAVAKYTQALAHDPTTTPANRGLADLYWTRLRRAEMRRDLLNTIYFETLVERYNQGKYDDLLEAHSDLRVDTEPSGARLTLFDYQENERRLEPTSPEQLGTSPVEAEALPLGSYLVKVDHERCRKIQQPVFIERDRESELDIHLPAETEFREGFRFVPGSTYISGGDPEAFNPRPPERLHVDPFFCQARPVTFGEYLEWFNELYDRDGEAAMVHAPQTRETDGLLIEWDEKRREWIPSTLLIEGSARERYPVGEGYEYDLPVLGLRPKDAEAYARWRSQRDGCQYRLPTVHEYEKAGRGVDGRRFPWGNHFDATFCKMRFSRPESPPQPEPVGQFDDDRSPYGVRDLAGCVQEWCRRPDDDGNYQPTKGGGWGQDERLCHLASTVDLFRDSRSARVGFRLVYEPDLE